jgi:predicted Fe-Mo cluster-binding NifX family protein
LSIAKQLASKGANVVIVAQNVPKLEAALEEIKVRKTPSLLAARAIKLFLEICEQLYSTFPLPLL